MRVILLGTGGSSGVPMIGGADGSGDWGACDPAESRNRRSRASIIIQSDAGQRLLVDTSPDMRNQLLDNRVRGFDAILYTHAHADHVTGLDDLRSVNRIVGRPLAALATPETLDELIRRFGYAFKEWEPPGFYRPVLLPQPVLPGDTAEAAGMTLRVFRQDHGYAETLGVRVERFAYSTDVVALNNEAFAMLEGVDTWVVGCFLRRGPHKTHAHLDLVLEWAERVRPRRMVLTHMGTDMDWAWLREHLPPGVEPGYDGMVLDVAI